MRTKQGMNYLSESELIERGWTKSGVSKFLGEPDWSPAFRAYGQTMNAKLYREERIKETENTDEWKIWRFKSEKRRESARARALVQIALREEEKAEEEREQQADREEFLAEVRKIPVRFTRKLPPLDKLRVLGEQHWVPAPTQDTTFTETPEEHSDRVTVNYLRHHCTNYDEILMDYDLMSDGYLEISKKVHELIARTFPDLKESCAKRVAYSVSRNTLPSGWDDDYGYQKPLLTSPKMIEKRHQTMVSAEDQVRLGLN